MIAGHVDILEYLLEEGCNPNLVDMYGQSPLHVAALTGNLHAVTLLYEGMSLVIYNNTSSQEVHVYISFHSVLFYSSICQSEFCSKLFDSLLLDNCFLSSH